MKQFFIGKTIRLSGLLVFGILLFNSCKKDCLPTSGPVVLVAGYESNGETNIAKYWVNDHEVILSNGTNSAQANSIFASDNNVYVAGSDGGAVYWKNNIESTLPVISEFSYAKSIFVTGNKTYIAGYDGGAVYWKNGIEVRLSVDVSSTANAIFVSGHDIYIAGTHNKNAVYWKNGLEVILTSPPDFEEANSIFVDGPDVYIAGIFIPEHCPCNGVKYWKNGVSIPLAPEFFASGNSVFVSNHHVYVAGSKGMVGFYDAVYWKDGTIVNVSNDTGGIQTAGATAIYVSGSDVYVAGVQNSYGTFKTKATYWKNNVEVNLTDGTQTAFTTSIFVK